MSKQNQKPYILSPTREEWRGIYAMLCGHCALQLNCEVIEKMIKTKNGGAYPENGWIEDEGAGVSCASYQPKKGKPFPPEKLQEIVRRPESLLPKQCRECAATKGSPASKTLHTNRDFSLSVKEKSTFLCHKGKCNKICGGWIRAIKAHEKNLMGCGE
jgi:hypothetical protein